MILLTSLAIYSGGWNNGFLINWDDPVYVTENPDIQSLTLENLYKIFSSFCLGNYAPIHLLSYMLDYALWGPTPLAFLLVNVALHGLNACLLYRLLCRFGFPLGWALLAALIFTVHPVQVESVAWISQRKNVLAMTFFIAAFWQYLDHVDNGRRGYRPYVLSLAFFLLALLTKSVSVIFPAILISYDLLLRERDRRLTSLALEKLPFVLLACGGALLGVVTQNLDYGGGHAHSPLGGSALSAFLTMLPVYKGYLSILFWPLHLSADYHVVIKQAIDAEVLFSAVLLLASLASVLLAGRSQRRMAGFWLAVFFIGFVPVSQLVPFIHPMNDRYLYFPMLGFATVLVLLLQNLVARFRVLGGAVCYGSIGMLLLLAVASWQRTGVWASSLSLWQDAVAKQPGAMNARANLANAYEKSGDDSQALVHYRHALTLDESAHEVHRAVGEIAFAQGDLDTAVRHFTRVMELKPDDETVLFNLGYASLLTGQYPVAVQVLERGLRHAPEALIMRVYLGAGYYCMGNLPAARQAYEQVRGSGERSDLSVLATGMLALVVLRQGDEAASRRLWQEALAGGSSEAEIYLNWARLEALAQHREEALGFLVAALSRGAGGAELAADQTFRSLHDDAEFRRMVNPKGR